MARKPMGYGKHFNSGRGLSSGLTKEGIRRIQKAAAAAEKAGEGIDEEIRKVEEQIEKLRLKRSELMKKAGYVDDDFLRTASSSRMLNELYRVYRSKGGMKYLEQEVDKTGGFLELVKEIMRMEKEMQKKAPDDGFRPVFVILRNLFDDQGMVRKVAVTPDGKEIDLGQMSIAMDPYAELSSAERANRVDEKKSGLMDTAPEGHL